MALNDLQKAFLKNILVLKTSVIDPDTGVEVDWGALGGSSGLNEAAVQALIDASVANLVNSAPGALNTLEELADALGDDANFAATMTTALAGKQPVDSDLTAIAALTTTSYGRAFLALADAAAGRTALGLGTAAVAASGDFDAAGAAAAAQAAAIAASQPVDSDLTAIAALSTTSTGRSLLAAADAAALRTILGLGTAATHATGDYDATGAAAAAQAASQPVDSDLTAIAALTTTSYGRAFLALADAAAARTALALGTAATTAASAYEVAGAAAAAQAAAIAASQPVDSDLTAIAALTTTSYGRSLLALADAAAGRTALGLGTAATTAASAYDAAGAAATAQAAAIAASQPVDSDLTAIAALTTTSFGRSVLAAADASALQTIVGVSTFIKTLLDDADAATARTTLGVTAGVTDYSVCQGRLTLTTAVPVTTTDVTAATTLYFTPYKGNLIGTYSGSAWSVNPFTEKSITLASLTAGLPYDVYIVDGTLALELLAWTNATTRATALVLQDGIYCKTGVLTRRYLGTICITATTGQCEDSLIHRLVWNYYNRVVRSIRTQDAGAGWTYATAAWRAANNTTTAHKLDYICGLSEDLVRAHVLCYLAVSGASVRGTVGVGVDATNANSAQLFGESGETSVSELQVTADYVGYPGVGYHYLAWVEYARVGTVTFDPGDGSTAYGGMTGEVWS